MTQTYIIIAIITTTIVTTIPTIAIITFTSVHTQERIFKAVANKTVLRSNLKQI